MYKLSPAKPTLCNSYNKNVYMIFYVIQLMQRNFQLSGTLNRNNFYPKPLNVIWVYTHSLKMKLPDTFITNNFDQEPILLINY